MYKINTHIHFIGIGGIGMSAIALILQEQGYKVSGCDCNLKQKSVQKLKKLGCTVFEGNNSSQCHDTSIDIVVYSTAIRQDNPELIAAQKRGIPVVSRAQMLAELMRTKESIAVAGSHGKTTTSSLIAHVLIETDQDPTVVIGGHLQSIDSNARLGKSSLLVAEADESDRSFLLLPHSINVITNVDLEHLDTYRDLNDIKQTFVKFIENLPFYGRSIVCIDDTNTATIVANLPLQLQKKIITYGFSENSDFRVSKEILDAEKSTALLYYKNSRVGQFTVAMPGQHNLLNAVATLAVTNELGVPFEKTAAALATFRGVDRRFTFKGRYKGAELFDDYGHHPVEIENVLKVARKRSQSKLIVLFQPHRYTRTKALWNDFVKVLTQAPVDHLVITDIYPASEDPIDTITSERLVKTIQQAISPMKISYIPSDQNFTQIHEKLDSIVSQDDLVLFLGAGRINSLINHLT